MTEREFFVQILPYLHYDGFEMFKKGLVHPDGSIDQHDGIEVTIGGPHEITLWVPLPTGEPKGPSLWIRNIDFQTKLVSPSSVLGRNTIWFAVDREYTIALKTIDVICNRLQDGIDLLIDLFTGKRTESSCCGRDTSIGRIAWLTRMQDDMNETLLDEVNRNGPTGLARKIRKIAGA